MSINKSVNKITQYLGLGIKNIVESEEFYLKTRRFQFI